MASAASLATPFGGIRPTAMERARGRLLRAPDHDSSTGGGDAGQSGGEGGEAQGDGGDAATTEQPAQTDAAPGEAAQDKTGTETDTSLLGGDLTEGGDKGGEGAKGDEEAPAERIVPEKYEIAIEGMDLDQAALDEASEVFKEVGLTNDEAVKLMPAAAKFKERVETATLQQLVDAGAVQKAGWLKETKDHPDIGGANLEQTLHLAGKAFDHFGIEAGSDFRKLLTETGFGNHPEMVRIMRGVGEMLSEDGFPRSGAGEAKSDPLTQMYPNNRRSK
ncbi:hypothetical protein [Novosphingobium resinovorum]|nr:hypothetical protein [Novosphingobium resinovorum]